ncbi:MAG: ribonuclease P protein component [Ruminococcaceae bacterium]|nr:ribonuclease P protein component [Oscillospiraceae bacterium]
MKNIAIREHHLYNKAFQKGKRQVGKYVAVYVLRDLAAKRIMNAHPEKKYVNRLGLSVSKKLGGAVQRNRAKRVVRAAYDTLKDELYTGNLIVISPRNAVLDAKSTQVAEEMRAAFSQLGLLKQTDEECADNSKKI